MAEEKVKVIKDWENLTVTIKGYGVERVYDLKRLSDDMKNRCLVLGGSNKLRDSYAGKDKTPKWWEYSDEVYHALCDDVWERKPESKLKKLEELAESGVFTNKQIAVLKKLGLIK